MSGFAGLVEVGHHGSRPPVGQPTRESRTQTLFTSWYCGFRFGPDEDCFLPVESGVCGFPAEKVSPAALTKAEAPWTPWGCSDWYIPVPPAIDPEGADEPDKDEGGEEGASGGIGTLP